MDPNTIEPQQNPTPGLDTTPPVQPTMPIAAPDPVVPMDPTVPVVPTDPPVVQQVAPLPFMTENSNSYPTISPDPGVSTVPAQSVQTEPNSPLAPVAQTVPSGMPEVNPYTSVQSIGPLTDVPPIVQPVVPPPETPITPNLVGEPQNKMSSLNMLLLLLAIVLIVAMGYVAYVKLTAKTTTPIVPEQIQVVPTEAPIPTVEPTPTAVEPTVMPATDSPDVITTVPSASPSATP